MNEGVGRLLSSFTQSLWCGARLPQYAGAKRQAVAEHAGGRVTQRLVRRPYEPLLLRAESARLERRAGRVLRLHDGKAVERPGVRSPNSRECVLE